MTEVWTKREGLVVNGVFPLRRFLCASDHGAVFLTEYAARDLPNAVLKLVPATWNLVEAQLKRWTNAASLSHPHLIRLLETGRCRIGDSEFLFVVMDYAEQTLAQILPQRPLTQDEVREMLVPALSALAFLHGKNLVHGQLKPSNILVVDDQLKLSCDTIRAAGESAATLTELSAYDPPEAIAGIFSTAGDIWALGVTLVEALTQQLPTWADSAAESAIVSAPLPATLEKIVRQCLDRNPANRPTVAQLETAINPAPQVPMPAAPQAPVSQSQAPVLVPEQLELIPKPPVRQAPQGDIPRAAPPQHRYLLPAIAILLVLAIAVWVGSRLLNSRASLQPPEAAAAAAQTPDTSLSVASPAQPSASESPFVLHEEIPELSPHARDTIRGHIKIAVRVTVDSSGTVVHEALESRGPSYYFARIATEAAKKWKFVPANTQDSRKWLLRFEFTRDGVTGHAVASRS